MLKVKNKQFLNCGLFLRLFLDFVQVDFPCGGNDKKGVVSKGSSIVPRESPSFLKKKKETILWKMEVSCNHLRKGTVSLDVQSCMDQLYLPMDLLAASL